MSREYLIMLAISAIITILGYVNLLTSQPTGY